MKDTRYITGGGKWRWESTHLDLAEARIDLAVITEDGGQARIIELAASKTSSKKYGIPAGQKFWQVQEYRSRRRQVLA